MRMTLTALVLLGGSLGASAQDTPSLEKQAYKCWNIPGGYAVLPPPILLTIALDAGGQVTDVTATADADLSDQMTESAAKAIHRCSPYKGVRSGIYDLKMDATAALNG